MRVIVPDRIKKLADMQMPYMYFNEEHDTVELRADAPAEIVKAREEYLAWWKQYTSDCFYRGRNSVYHKT